MRAVEEKIIRILSRHEGPEEAIHAWEISQQVGLCEREVRRIISRLELEEALPFVLGRRPGHGFWRVADYEEAQEVLNFLTRTVTRSNNKLMSFLSGARRQGLHFDTPDLPQGKNTGITEKTHLRSLINRLRSIQEDLKMSDKKFTAKIGIARITWTLLRQNKYKHTGGRNLVGRLQEAVKQLEAAHA